MSIEPLNRQEKEDLIIDLYYNQKKTFREIQQIVRKSPRDIKIILNEVEPGRSSLSILNKVELTKLRLQKEKLESLVRQFQNNNENFRRIKELVKQAVEQSLTSHRHVLKIALLSVIDS